MAKIIPTYGDAFGCVAIKEKNQRQKAAVVAGLNSTIRIQSLSVNRAHGFGLEQLTSVVVAPAGQVIELEILRDRTKQAGVEEVDAVNAHASARYVFQRQPFADDGSSGINHVVLRDPQAGRFKFEVELKCAL